MGTKEILLELLSDNATALIVKKHRKYSVTFIEKSDEKSDEKLYEFELSQIPEDSIVIKCDTFPNLGEDGSKFFKGDNGECKRADYVLISESEKVIMLFEFKKSNKSSTKKDKCLQLKGAKCVVDYCKIIAESFLGTRNIFDGFQYKYYIIYHTFSRKIPHLAIDLPSNFTPDTPRIIAGPFISFGYL